MLPRVLHVETIINISQPALVTGILKKKQR
jgi:hypothetical protein